MTSKIIGQRSDEEVDKIVKSARLRMNDEAPIFGIVASEMIYMPAPQQLRNKIRTAGVTRSGLCMYNPDFVKTLTFNQLKGLLAHEALHPALDYWGRFEHKLKQYSDLCNRAHDYSINDLIKEFEESGVELPPKGLWKAEYKGLSGEQIFQILLEDAAKNPQQGGGDNGEPQQGDGGDSSPEQGNGEGTPVQGSSEPQEGQGDESLLGDVNSTIEDLIEKHYQDEVGKGGMTPEQSKEDITERIKNAKERMRDAVYRGAKEQEKAGGQGNLPAWMKAELDGILHPKLSIDKLLKKFFGRHGRKTFTTYKKRNRRNTFETNTIVRPGLIQKSPELWVLIDTSGSMWDKEGFDTVRGTMGIIQKLARNDSCNVRIVMCDTNVHSDIPHDQVMDALNKKNIQLLGGGGSDFTSAFEYIWEMAKKESLAQAPILCITDGAITVPEKQMRGIATDTAWVTPVGIQPPTDRWGRHYEMKFE